MKINLKKIRKKKLKAVEKIEKQFKPDIYRAAALSAGTEFRSVEVNLQQAEQFPVLVELGGALTPTLEVLENIQPTRIARDLEAHGLHTALVVTTDDLLLGGHPGWINLVKYHTQLPVIARDFFFHPIQVYQARATGADAVIVDFRWVDDATGLELVNTAFEMGMEPVVQVEPSHVPSGLDTEIIAAVILSVSSEMPVEEVDATVQRFKREWGERIPVIAEVHPENPALAALARSGAVNGLLITPHLLASENYIQRFAEILDVVGTK